MQAESSNDFKVPKPISILCGGLDLQIEHHMFPKLPPHRLREISAEVEEVCTRHGVAYRKASWPRTLGKALKRIARLSQDSRGGLSRLKAVANGMV
jgi:linoleoyl-CoA desaturase